MIRLVLFDIDGTLIRTGGAVVAKAFGKVFETEFGVLIGFDRLKFAGRTDYSLVREFFSFHQIAPTPENYRRFFERYVFWFDHILSAGGSRCAPEWNGGSKDYALCRARPCWGCSPATFGWERKSNCVMPDFGILLCHRRVRR